MNLYEKRAIALTSNIHPAGFDERRLADDPWTSTDQLQITSIDPWNVFVGAERLASTPAATRVDLIGTPTEIAATREPDIRHGARIPQPSRLELGRQLETISQITSAIRPGSEFMVKCPASAIVIRVTARHCARTAARAGQAGVDPGRSRGRRA
jgi:hypothetical protein